jgi:hypothetical protein
MNKNHDDPFNFSDCLSSPVLSNLNLIFLFEDKSNVENMLIQNYEVN